MCPHVVSSEELSDEYQTDYDEEAVESALSDFEAVTPGSEYTEGEETADTAETVCTNQNHHPHCSPFSDHRARNHPKIYRRQW